MGSRMKDLPEGWGATERNSEQQYKVLLQTGKREVNSGLFD